ncbi:hypothetical protein [Brucella intermedia]|uniref:hypothetical protein n=1 Tax=Brucella intermedia TaxID=94625 RepID=UPI00244E8377|nr:hypothetical protein [Brucella intermedia]WGJ06625.1 hypothetical protein QBQ48_12305 [Brucella intermedia]
MRVFKYLIAASLAFGALSASVAMADPWKDESGHGRWANRHYDDDYRPRRHYRERKHEYKEEFRRGRCKIKREWDDGEYKEEIKCKKGYRRPAYYDDYYRY